MKLEILHQECCRILTHLGIKIRNEQVDFTEYATCCGSEPIRFLFKCQTAYHDFDCLYRDGCASCGGLLDISKFEMLNLEKPMRILSYINLLRSCQTNT